LPCVGWQPRGGRRLGRPAPIHGFTSLGVEEAQIAEDRVPGAVFALLRCLSKEVGRDSVEPTSRSCGSGHRRFRLAGHRQRRRLPLELA
jgi:hypothetical protein